MSGGPSLRERQENALRSHAGGAALLVVDVQRSFADPEFLAEYGLSHSELGSLEAAVKRCGEAVDHARAAGVPVVWIELESAVDSHWRASSWLNLGDPAAPLLNAPCASGTAGAEWYSLSPAPGEMRIVKRRYSGFAGTTLAQQLREAGVGWVSVAGLTTECCVAATAFDAFQSDFSVVVLSDATAAYSASLHEGALAALSLNAGIVMSSDDVAALWRERRVAA
ncbi:cysteine hydrolase [Microbacterium sediminicola]|uniref:Cysteine hydrolase n=1 Tax=Microbacterium sediminicola TaxID=415210 RepID=A0ABN2IEM2_9MICO